MPHWLDWKNGGARAPRFWTDDELDLLLSGQPVPYRTASGCACKLWKLGIRNGPGHYLAKAPYKPPTPVPGKIPWPAWWRRAHLMRMEGLQVTEISRILGLHTNTVRGALYPEFHASQRQRQQRRRQKLVSLGKTNKQYGKPDRMREKLRKVARLEWRYTGGEPRSLERFYRALDCL